MASDIINLSAMKPKLIRRISIFIIAIWGFYLMPQGAISFPEECENNQCATMQEMSCCATGEMQHDSCQCPDMEQNENDNMHKLPEVPVRVSVKISQELVVLAGKLLPSLLTKDQGVFYLTSIVSLPFNTKIYKEIHTYLI